MPKVYDQTYPGAILRAVVAERKFQDEKYGTIDKGGGHDLTGWLIVLQKELDEAMDAATGHGKRGRTGRHTVRSEILQITAVCFAALEQHGLTDGTHSAPIPAAPRTAPTKSDRVKQEIRDLFARYGSGNYMPSEGELQVIETTLDEIIDPLLIDAAWEENERST